MGQFFVNKSLIMNAKQLLILSMQGRHFNQLNSLHVCPLSVNVIRNKMKRVETEKRERGRIQKDEGSFLIELMAQTLEYN